MKPRHVHFMGIGGSGLAGVAILAQEAGFKVTGCDLKAKTYYTAGLKKAGIKPLVGHCADHLSGVDILAVSPAILDINPRHPEVVQAKKSGILITWQEFMGRYLQKNKYVIAVGGTHGKSTTTALMGLVLEAGGLDPIVEVGAIVPKWNLAVRPGQSKYFVCEADEFNHNFLHFSPSLIIINNIEMDHPEFFRDFVQFKDAFRRFIHQLTGPKILIVNEESLGIQQLLQEQADWLAENKVKVIGYFLQKRFSFTFAEEYQGSVKKITPEGTKFEVRGPATRHTFTLKMAGLHQVANSLGVIAAARKLKVSPGQIARVLNSFQGIKRRFELVGQAKGVQVFDDYAVHPTSVAATLKAARQKFPQSRLWAVFEPHQFSRLGLFLADFSQALSSADKVIVTKTYAGREKKKGKTGPADLVQKIGARAIYQPDFAKLAVYIARRVRKNDVVFVFGAGQSYQVSRLILQQLK